LRIYDQALSPGQAEEIAKFGYELWVVRDIYNWKSPSTVIHVKGQEHTGEVTADSDVTIPVLNGPGWIQTSDQWIMSPLFKSLKVPASKALTETELIDFAKYLQKQYDLVQLIQA